MKALEEEASCLQACISLLADLSPQGQQRVVTYLAAGLDAAPASMAPPAPSALGGRPMKSQTQQLLELLVSGRTPHQVAQALGVSRSAVSGAAHRAERAGRIERVGKAKYRWKGESS